MRPIVHGLEAEYWGRIDFIYLDIDNPVNAKVKSDFGFTAQPLFIFIAPDGTEQNRWFGYVHEDEFRQAFDAYLASHDS